MNDGHLGASTYAGAGVRVDGFDQARESLKTILDCSGQSVLSMANLPGRASAAAVNGVSPRHHLTLDLVPNLRVVNADAAWAVFTPGQPFAVEPPLLEEALEDFVDDSRDNAEDREEHLPSAPGRREIMGAGPGCWRVYGCAVDPLAYRFNGVSNDSFGRRDEHEKPRATERRELVLKDRRNSFVTRESTVWSVPTGGSCEPVFSSPADRTTDSASVWNHILRDQPTGADDEFWACVERGVLTARGCDLAAGGPSRGTGPATHPRRGL